MNHHDRATSESLTMSTTETKNHTEETAPAIAPEAASETSSEAASDTAPETVQRERRRKKPKRLQLPPPPKSYLKRPEKYCYDEALGRPRVFGRAFAIPFLSHEIENFLKEKCPQYYCVGPQAGLMFQKAFQLFVPPEVRRIAFLLVPFPVKLPNGNIKLDIVNVLGIVIGSNLTDEDMEQAENQELIKKTQEGLGVTTPPAWYFFKNG